MKKIKKVVVTALTAIMLLSGASTLKTSAAIMYNGDKNTNVWYRAQVQDIGWQGDGNSMKMNGDTAGTTGQAKRLEALQITVDGGAPFSVNYQVHVQNKGWMPSTSNGGVAGTTGEALRMEAIAISLSEKNTSTYKPYTGADIYYRVHVSGIGWMEWHKNGDIAGTTGQAKAIEAIEIQIRPAGQQPLNPPTPPQIDKGQALVDEARAHKSLVTYVPSADDSDNHRFDCSSFTKHIFEHQGIRIGRTTWDQMNYGTPVAQSDLQVGDLVFTYGGGHVGIYTGNGYYIHNSDVGVNVKESPVNGFYTARRVR